MLCSLRSAFARPALGLTSWLLFNSYSEFEVSLCDYTGTASSGDIHSILNPELASDLSIDYRGSSI